MRYWWVNQNQTYAQETEGGYLWSPKCNSNGARNPFYESMREVSPGDIILSFQGTYIRAIGIAVSYCHEFPKPTEFGNTGANWGAIGWKVNVNYIQLNHQIRPRDHMDVLGPHLSDKYSPLQATGRGNQGVYLAEVSTGFAETIAQSIGQEAMILLRGEYINDEAYEQPVPDQELWEEKIRDDINSDNNLPSTEKQALVISRRGQGKFKDNVCRVERRCRVTGVDRLEHLRASHIKPWRDSNNVERLDGENGFLLTPSIDHLFDRGFISFEDNGRLLISPVSHNESLNRMGVDTNEQVNVGGFTEGQRTFLDFHREFIFLETRR